MVTRSNDINVQKSLNMILKSVFGLIDISKVALFDPSNIKVIASKSFDIIALLSTIAQGLNQVRRELMKPKLPTNVQKLAFNVQLDADELFGSKYFNKRVTKLTASNKAFAKPEAGSYFKKAGNFSKTYQHSKNSRAPQKNPPYGKRGNGRGRPYYRKPNQ